MRNEYRITMRRRGIRSTATIEARTEEEMKKMFKRVFPLAIIEEIEIIK